MIDPAYWIAMVLIALKVCFRAIFDSFNLVSRSFIEEVCVVPLAPIVMTMSGSTIHHWVMMLLMNGWYL